MIYILIFNILYNYSHNPPLGWYIYHHYIYEPYYRKHWKLLKISGDYFVIIWWFNWECQSMGLGIWTWPPVSSDAWEGFHGGRISPGLDFEVSKTHAIPNSLSTSCLQYKIWALNVSMCSCCCQVCLLLSFIMIFFWQTLIPTGTLNTNKPYHL